MSTVPPGVRQLRQGRVLEALLARLARLPQFSGALLIGSFAVDRADPLSDLDLVLAADDFDLAWARRGELHPGEALAAWDVREAFRTFRAASEGAAPSTARKCDPRRIPSNRPTTS